MYVPLGRHAFCGKSSIFFLFQKKDLLICDERTKNSEDEVTTYNIVTASNGEIDQRKRPRIVDVFNLYNDPGFIFQFN